MQWLDYVPWRDEFAKAMDQRLFTIEWLDQRVAEGSAMLWTSPNAAMLTEYRDYPTGVRAAHVVYAAGSIPEMVDILRPQIEAAAISASATCAFVDSHPGWQRILKPHGYETYKTMTRKDL